MLFSIIIPVYNVAAYLEECVDSILAQTYRRFEIILVDDGSTDGSGKMCDDLARLDSRIRVIHQENKGLSAARNSGLEHIRGDYILFLDSDDRWSGNDVLDALEKRIAQTDPDVLSFNYVKFCGQYQEEPYLCQKQSDFGNTHNFRKDMWIACAWNKAVRRSLFSDNGLRFVEGIFSEDMDWCVRLALRAERFDYLEKVVVCYRQREESISKTISAAKLGDVVQNIRRCLILLEDNKTERAQQLRPFVSYQYGTALHHLAKLPKQDRTPELLEWAGELQYLLSWSDNWKIRLLRLSTGLGGLKFTLTLLKLRRG